MNCPRCRSAKQHLRTEYQGREGDVVLWTVRHCNRCSFTWRDSEPAESIDYAQNGKPGSELIRTIRKNTNIIFLRRKMMRRQEYNDRRQTPYPGGM